MAILLGACTQDSEIHALEPQIAVSPEAVEFGEVVVEYTETALVEVINAGKADLVISDVSLVEATTAAFDHDGAATTLEPDDRLEVTVSCTPTTFTTYTDTLLVQSNDQELPDLEIPISCTGVDAPTPDIELDTQYLDFGTVSVGSTASDWFTITNTGDGDLQILSTAQSGSGAFEVVTDPEGTTVSPNGDEYVVLVDYVPTTEGGDWGELEIVSDDPDESEVLVLFDGNGGGEDEYPVAVIDAVEETSPLETVDLDGTESYDPDGYELTYEWSLTDLPTGSTAEITGASGDVSSLFLDLAGDYQVELVVENEMGVRSAPAKHDLSAIPTEDLRVEMYWDTSSTDLDLHLVQDDGSFFLKPGDCCYCNPNPEWGEEDETADDPTLDLDDISGRGPENINISSPEDGAYHIYVHYYEDNGGGATTATVRVYLDKEEEFEESRVLERNELWYVGYIQWPERLVVENETEDPTEAERRGCYSDEE